MATDEPISSMSSASNPGIDMNNDLDRDDPMGDMAQQLTLGQALLQVHPDYEDRIDKWEKYADCYSANDIYRFVRQHPREHEDSFKERVSRSYYLNYCQSIVELFVAYLYHAPVDRRLDEDTEAFDGFHDNADLSGTKFNMFMQIASTFAQISGHVGVLVDAPAIDDPVQSEAERKQRALRPYTSIITAQQILDWEMDEFDRFVWVKIEIDQPTGRSWRDPAGSDERHFVIWDREKWTKGVVRNASGTDPEGEIVDSREHDLGEVPLVIVRNEIDINHRWFGQSAIRDIADINLAILNWSTLGDEEIANRCLNVLVAQRGGDDDAVNISHNNVLEYAEGAEPPTYLVPGETPLKLILEWIQNAKDEIFRLAKLGGSTGLLGVREATSGIAYAFEFNETNQSLAKKAESLEQGEVDIHRLVAKWQDKEFNGTITYPKEFGVDDFIQELQILMESREGLTSPTAIKEIEKKVVAKLFSREPQKLREKMQQEVENSDPQAAGVSESFDTVPDRLTREPNNPDTGEPQA